MRVEQESREKEKGSTFKLVNLRLTEALFFVVIGCLFFLVGIILGVTGNLTNEFCLVGVALLAGEAFCSIRNTFLETKIKKVPFNTVLIIISKNEPLTYKKIEKILTENTEQTRDQLLQKWGVKKMLQRLANYGYLEEEARIIPAYKITNKGLELIKSSRL